MPYAYQGDNIYGAGDYYQGDYYQAGGLFDVLGAAFKVGKSVVSKIRGKGSKSKARGTKFSRGRGRGMIPQVPAPGMRGAIQRALPGGASGMMGVPAGYHVNKAYARYLKRANMGADVQDPTQQPRVKNLVVRNRRMNPLNPSAFRRGSRRVGAGVNILKKAISGTGYTVKRTGLPRGRKKK